jgi:hypothetical protein
MDYRMGAFQVDTVKPHLSALYCSKNLISGQAHLRYPLYPLGIRSPSQLLTRLLTRKRRIVMN